MVIQPFTKAFWAVYGAVTVKLYLSLELAQVSKHVWIRHCYRVVKVYIIDNVILLSLQLQPGVPVPPPSSGYAYYPQEGGYNIGSTSNYPNYNMYSGYRPPYPPPH